MHRQQELNSTQNALFTMLINLFNVSLSRAHFLFYLFWRSYMRDTFSISGSHLNVYTSGSLIVQPSLLTILE